MPLPNPDADDHRRDLREATRSFLGHHFPVAGVRDGLEAPAQLDRAAWRRAAEMGWIALLAPEAHGGIEGEPGDLELVAEELGRALFTGPFLGTALATALLAGGDGPAGGRLLSGLADGSLTGAWAFSDAADPWTADAIGGTAAPDGDGVRLDAVKAFVADAPLADVLVVTVRQDDGLASFAVPRDAPGLTITEVPTLDLTRPLATVALDGVRVGADAAVGDGAGSVDRALALGAVLAAADAVGAAERLLDLTVEYAGQRTTFGRVIGSYQAVKHKCADMLWWLEGARVATRTAAATLDPHQVHVAKACAERLHRTARGREPAAPRRHRLHLGARPAPVPAPHQGRRGAVRRRRAPRAPPRRGALASGPPWRLSGAQATSVPRRTPDEGSR